MKRINLDQVIGGQFMTQHSYVIHDEGKIVYGHARGSEYTTPDDIVTQVCEFLGVMITADGEVAPRN